MASVIGKILDQQQRTKTPFMASPSLPVLPGQVAASPEQIAAHLGPLALNYWTPDMSPEQARWKYQTFFEDLSGCSEPEVRTACLEYRRNAANKFFPTSAQILEIVIKNRKDMPAAGRRDLPADPRPHFWWCLSIWKPHWRESEIPIEEIRAFELRKQRVGEPRRMA